MKSEPWFIELFAAAVKDKFIGLFGGTQVIEIDVAVAVQHFKERQTHRSAGRSVDAHAHPADHVLAHIHYALAFGRLEGAYSLDLCGFDDRRALRRYQGNRRRRFDPHRLPILGRIACGAPPRFLQTAVIAFAMINIVGKDRAG